MRPHHPRTVKVLLLAIAVASHLGYTGGSRRAAGNPEEPTPESGPCRCSGGRLVRQNDGRYRCRRCGHSVDRLPETR